MNTPPPAKNSAIPSAISSARQAALFSLLVPIVFGICVNLGVKESLRGNQVGMRIFGSVFVLLILAGFILGVVALFATKKYGRKGIWGKAMGGVFFGEAQPSSPAPCHE